MKAKLTVLIVVALLSPLFLVSCEESSGSNEFIYVGNYTDSEDGGLYVYEFNREDLQFTLTQYIGDRVNTVFQAIHPEGHVLYSVSRDVVSEGTDFHTIGAYRIHPDTGTLDLITERSVEGINPAHVSVDPSGRFVYVSNYVTGNISVFEIDENGGLSESVDVVQHTGSSIHSRQEAAHIHAADPSPDGRFLYASDLGSDKIYIYKVDQESGILSPAETPFFNSSPGSGPRHFTFHPSGEYAYSVEELSSTVTVFKVDQNSGEPTQIQRVDMLPNSYNGENTAADIHTSPDGKFLYASNRGHDSLVIYTIEESTGLLNLVGHESTRGGHPRNFLMDQKGEFILVANLNDDSVVVFSRDVETGELMYTGTELHVPAAVCLTQLITG